MVDRSGVWAATILSLVVGAVSACGGGEVDRDGAVGADDDALTSGDASQLPTAPRLLYDGPREGAQIASWDPDVAGAMIILSQSLATSEWLGSIGKVDASGTITTVVSDGRVLVWGWPSRTALGSPDSIYRGSGFTASLNGWDPSSPDPLLALSVSDDFADVFVINLTVSVDGDASTIIIPTLEIFGWEADGPQLLYDGPEAGATVPGWNPDAPRPIVSFSRSAGATWSTLVIRLTPDGELTGDAERLVLWGW